MPVANDFRHTYNPEFFQNSWLCRERTDPSLERLCLSLASTKQSHAVLGIIRQQLLQMDAELITVVAEIDASEAGLDVVTIAERIGSISLAYQAEPEIVSLAMDAIRETSNQDSLVS